MSDMAIEYKDVVEFEYDGFNILFEDDIWYVAFEDPELDLIVIADSEGKHFGGELMIKDYAFTNEEFEELKKAIKA